MYCKENYMGKITVADRFIKKLVCRAVSGCFGVAGMGDRSFADYIISDVLKLKALNKGVIVKTKGDKLSADIHITVTYGTNIAAVKDSIRSKVRFAINEYTGLPVDTVNVYIDGVI